MNDEKGSKDSGQRVARVGVGKFAIPVAYFFTLLFLIIIFYFFPLKRKLPMVISFFIFLSYLVVLNWSGSYDGISEYLVFFLYLPIYIGFFIWYSQKREKE